MNSDIRRIINGFSRPELALFVAMGGELPKLNGKESEMLVLSRQRGESIIIDNDIEIVVVDIRGDKIRLGINAPKDVSVHRKEVYLEIQRKKRK